MYLISIKLTFRWASAANPDLGARFPDIFLVGFVFGTKQGTKCESCIWKVTRARFGCKFDYGVKERIERSRETLQMRSSRVWKMNWKLKPNSIWIELMRHGGDSNCWVLDFVATRPLGLDIFVGIVSQLKVVCREMLFAHMYTFHTTECTYTHPRPRRSMTKQTTIYSEMVIL